MKNSSILIVDDDPDFGQDLAALLGSQFTCRLASTGEEGLGMIACDPPDAVILDLRFDGGRDGLTTLDEIRRLDPAIPVIMATGHPTDETEAEALRRGALYYVRKAAGREELVSKLEKCLEVGELARQRDGFSRELSENRTVFLTASPAMRQLEVLIDRVASAPTTTVLLTGESGTGKSLIAREIHRRGPRRPGPFLHVNMPTIREELIDSTLFGHKRGAFTGAVSDHAGHFEAARGGTVFLDEVGGLSLPVQSRLLTVLEEREILPVGSSTPRRVDVRVIAATSADLSAQVRAGTFRQDLLGRLNVVTLHVPPLREHPEDVPALVHYYLGHFAAQMKLPNVGIAPQAMDCLRRHSWRWNNIRELKNTVERALVFHGHAQPLGPECFDLPDACDPPETFDYGLEKLRAVAAFQRRFFTRAFQEVGGALPHPNAESIARVAERTGLPPQTVRRILKELAEGPSPSCTPADS